MPRILLLHPHNPLEGYHYAVPQVALGYLSAALKQKGFTDVHIRDAMLYHMDVEAVVHYATELKPDLVGIRGWSHQIPVVLEYAKRIKANLPHVKMVLGGPHPTLSPDFVWQAGDIDYGIAGEAEEGFPMLLQHIFDKPQDLTKIPGLLWREDGKLRSNAMSKVEELDRFSVDWEVLDLRKYHELNRRTTAYDHGKSKNAFIFMTRGCPYPCTYCAAYLTNGKAIRSHSGKRMLDDIEHLYNHYGVRHFNLMDDNFTFYREVVLDFCDEFEKRRARLPGVTFHNPNGVRVDRLDDEVLARMKKCGWQWLHIGIESACENTLKRMKKRLDIKLAAKNIEKIRKHGLKCWGFFMIGFADETSEDIEVTIDWAIKSKLNAATFSIFSPIPGTDVYKEMLKEGRISDDYLMSGYFSTKTTVFAKGMGPEDLNRFQRNALIRFYSRPDRALHLIQGMDWGTFFNRVQQVFFPADVRNRILTSLRLKRAASLTD